MKASIRPNLHSKKVGLDETRGNNNVEASGSPVLESKFDQKYKFINVELVKKQHVVFQKCF